MVPMTDLKPKLFDTEIDCLAWIRSKSLSRAFPSPCHSNGNWGKWMAIEATDIGVFALVSPENMIHLSEW